MKISKVSIKEKFSLFHDHWNPRIVGELNGQHVKLAKIQGVFDWHSHADEDEMFLVIDGEFDMELRDKTITIRQGEFVIIPRGVEHRPITKEEVQIMLFEPTTTVNTGSNERSEKTRDRVEWI